MPTLRMESLALELWRSRVERSPKMRKEQQKRRIAGVLCGAVCVVCVVCAAFALAYLLDSSHFTSRELEPVVSDMMKYVLSWTSIALVALILAAYSDGTGACAGVHDLRLVVLHGAYSGAGV